MSWPPHVPFPVPMNLRDQIAPHIPVEVAFTMRRTPRDEMTTGEAEAYARGRAEALAPLCFGTENDARLNLTGALYDIVATYGLADIVSVNTIGRVIKQLRDCQPEHARAGAPEAADGAGGMGGSPDAPDAASEPHSHRDGGV